MKVRMNWWWCLALTASLAAAQDAGELVGKLTDPTGPLPAGERPAAYAQAVDLLAPGLALDDAGRRQVAKNLLEKLVHHAARPGAEDERQAMSGALVKLLLSNQPKRMRIFYLQMLQVIGGREAIGPLVALLDDGDADVAEVARLALANNPDPGAGKALLEALDRAKDAARLGLVTALGYRREASAVASLAKLLTGETALANAAAQALQQIATEAALAALLDAKPQDGGIAAQTLDTAVLDAAEKLWKSGQGKLAAQACEAVFKRAKQASTQAAALRGWALALGEGGLKLLLDQLDGDYGWLAARLAADFPGKDVAKAFAERLGKLAPDVQVVLIGALRERGEQVVLPALRALADGDATEAVKVAAVEAIGMLGELQDLDRLIRLLGDNAGGVKRAAQAALEVLGGDDVRDELLKRLKSATGADLNRILTMLYHRRGAVTSQALLDLAMADGDVERREAALETLGDVGRLEDFIKLVQAMPKLAAAGLGTVAAETARALQDRYPTGALEAQPILEVMDQAAKAARPALLRLLGATGSDKALTVLSAALADGGEAERAAALASFADWPNDKPVQSVLDFIASGKYAGPQNEEYAAARHLLALTPNRGEAELLAAALEGLKHLDGPGRLRSLRGLATIADKQALAALRAHLSDGPEVAGMLVTAADTLSAAYRDDALAAVDEALAATQDTKVKQAAADLQAKIRGWGNAVTAWRISPLYNPRGFDAGRLFNEKFDPETGKNPVRWELVPGSIVVEQGLVDLDRSPIFGNNRAVYLRTALVSNQAQAVRFEVGSDDGNKLWLNDKLISAVDASRAHSYGADKIDVQLVAGRNELLFKIINGGGNWRGSLKVVGQDGQPVSGVTATVE